MAVLIRGFIFFMKTNQVLERKMGDFKIAQRTKDGYFDANVLLRQWNESNTRRRIDKFLESQSTKEFINTITEQESQWSKSTNAEYQVVIVKKGRNTANGKTHDEVWMHPYLFIDFAMWINPKFKYEVIKFVYDELVKFRKEAGNDYKEMCTAIKLLSNEKDLIKNISKVAEALNCIVYGHHIKDIRNKEADEIKIKELVSYQKEVTKLINKKFIKSIDSLMQYLREEYKEKHLLL